MRGNVCLLPNLSYHRFGVLMQWPIHPLTIGEGVCSCKCADQPSTHREQLDELLADRARIRPEIEGMDAQDLIELVIGKR